jgi:serine protease Do
MLISIGSKPYILLIHKDMDKDSLIIEEINRSLFRYRRLEMNSKNVSRIMKVRTIVVTLVLVLTLSLTNCVFAQSTMTEAKSLSNAFSTSAKAAMPAVVSIKVEKTIETTSLIRGQPQLNDPFELFGDDYMRQFFGGRTPSQRIPQQYLQEGQGSGFIISKDGYILTNNHVVGDVDKITVELKDGRTFENAKLIGTDPDTEVALIKIDGDNFPVLPMGDSDKIEIGDWVIAIGNPFSLSETVTVGIISAVGRSMGIATYEDFIQTDAAINPGNSGGPLINLDGQVIGINTAIFSESGGYMGIGFAIPINMAKTIEKQLKEQGKVTRGYLGLSAQTLTKEMADTLGIKNGQGIIVAGIEKGTPADKAGIKSQDVITKVNGKKIESYDSFRNEIAAMKPGNSVKLSVDRNGKSIEIDATLSERPMTETAKSSIRTETPQSPQSTLGVNVQNVTRDIANQFGYAVGEGVIVSNVSSGSPADKAGIQTGDLIQSVNRQLVNSVDEYRKAVNEAKGDKIMLLIKRGVNGEQVSQFVVVQLVQ